MATSSFVIKCRTPSGYFTISELESHSTMKDLKDVIKKISGIQPEKMKILFGYPPTQIFPDNENITLDEVGIKSGESLIIRVDASPDVQVVPDLSESIANGFVKEGMEKDTSEAMDTSVAKDTSVANDTSVAKYTSVAKDTAEAKDTEKVNIVNPISHDNLMLRYEVPSNNSCLFSSIYFIIHDGLLDLTKVDELRNVVATSVSQDPFRFNDVYLGRENLQYCQWILNPINWGGAIELEVFSDFYQLEICAIDIMSCGVLRFGENKNYQMRGIVLYDGVHYDPLYMQREEGNMQTLFPTYDMHILDLALEIAREAQSCKQYVDVVNFKLKCSDCGKNFVGEKESIFHASVTGHINFDELR